MFQCLLLIIVLSHLILAKICAEYQNSRLTKTSNCKFWVWAENGYSTGIRHPKKNCQISARLIKLAKH
ncbi:unnamed protein product [Blepharisma stoltei]|uniref:Secreted protein n=1 Tax=Blepharisma stoltei TaxID=1481888 RepID=A0AAU9JTB9_9CILI|nr:unnamed protein product [Blepharisma stoltei]